jgi:hypothetical protein
MCTALLIHFEPAQGAGEVKRAPASCSGGGSGGNVHRSTRNANLRYFNRHLTTL